MTYGTAHGIVYAATQDDRYVEEAFLSAESAKRQSPALHITLFTDRPGNALCRSGMFDAVEPIDSEAFPDPRAAAHINRIRSLARTPYARTLYLDTDARVMSPAVPALFDALAGYDVALVEDALDTSNARRWSGLRLFNCGVMLFQSGPRFTAVLREWEARTLRYLTLAETHPLPTIPALAHVADDAIRRQLLRMDKIALQGVLPPDGAQTIARVLPLDASWNYRKAPGDKMVNILHLHDRTGPPALDLRALADTWTNAGRSHEAQRLYDYLPAL